MIRFLDVEIYDVENDPFAQARYLVHGHDDVLWTDDIEDVLACIKESAKPEHD